MGHDVAPCWGERRRMSACAQAPADDARVERGAVDQSAVVEIVIRIVQRRRTFAIAEEGEAAGDMRASLRLSG